MKFKSFALLFPLAWSGQIQAQEEDLGLLALLDVKIVTASKKEESGFVAPLSSSVITGEEIVASGATTIPEALRLIPGVIVQQEGPGVFKVTIRGLTGLGDDYLEWLNKSTLVMIDNRIEYNYYSGGVNWETLPIDIRDIKQIEVVRGPAAALYGPNAVSGVIHIITKRATAPGGTYFAGQFGTQKAKPNGEASYAINGENHSLRISVNSSLFKRFSSEIYSAKTQSYVEDWKHAASELGIPYSIDRFPEDDVSMRKKGVNLSYEYTPSADLKLFLNGSYQDSLVQDISQGGGAPNPFATRTSLARDALFSGNYKNFSTNITYRASALRPFVSTASLLNQKIKEVAGVVEYNFVGDGFEIKPGFEHREVSFDTLVYDHLAKYSNTAALLRGEFSPLENLRTIAAIRNDSYELIDKSYLSYQLSNTYRENEVNITRFNIGKANASPFVYNYVFHETQLISPFYQGTNGVYGNPNTPLPSQYLVELGHRIQMTSNLLVDGEAFHTIGKNDVLLKSSFLIELDKTKTPSTIYTGRNDAVNLPVTATQNGVTMSFEYRPDSKNSLLKAHLTAQETRLNGSRLVHGTTLVPTGTLITDTFVPAPKQHLGNPKVFGGLNFNQRISPEFSYNLDSYFFTRTETYNKRNSDSQKTSNRGILNAKLAYTYKKDYEFSVDLRNFLNKKQIEYPMDEKIGAQYLLGLEYMTGRRGYIPDYLNLLRRSLP
jgi:iron complex outermembrane receptor protein